MTHKTLFVAWQDPLSREWYPVGRLTFKNGLYEFVYTRGALEAKSFRTFGRMTELDSAYISTNLFPIFANRILPKSRPEYEDYMRWLGLSTHKNSELEELARTGGHRATDSLEIFPCPEPTKDGKYVAYFFSHGLRYLMSDSLARVSSLSSRDKLLIVRDVQNQFDRTALLLRTQDPISIAGYCPRYYSADFTRLLELVGSENMNVSVDRVNSDAPTRFRLLCRLSAPWPKAFTPCSGGHYEPIRSTKKSLATSKLGG